MVHPSTLPLLQEGKNLLAFSGGVDSSALFFLLQQNHIVFDIAIVNYQTREQSVKEVAYAHSLAEDFAKECFVLETSLTEQNFEATARNIRYDFFESLIKEHGYTNLITAHQLDDRLEWLLMQLSKGAGLYELLGTQTVEKRENYTLLRPLLDTTRTEIKTYLDKNTIRYFEDESNSDEKYKRNFFRHNLAAPLLERYASGIKKSFTYLNEDLTELMEQNIDVKSVQGLHYFEYPASRRSAIITADRTLKELGFLMRQGDKEALKTAEEHVVGRQYVVSFHPNYCFITPYLAYDMSKEFKEKCRLLKVPRKLRPYLYKNKDAFDTVVSLLNNSQEF
jgi:tRNA(Ile)-lysidine synthase